MKNLTVKNAPKAQVVVNKAHPEWGSKRFTFNGQPLNGGQFAHVVGEGSNSAVLFTDDFKFWAVVA